MFRVLFTDLATTRIMLRITCVLNMLALLSSFALSILFSRTEIPYSPWSAAWLTTTGSLSIKAL